MPNLNLPTCSAISEVPISTKHAVGLLRSWTNQTVSVWICGSAQLQMASSMRGDLCEVDVTTDEAGNAVWIELRSDGWTLKANGTAHLMTGGDGAPFAVTITHDDKAKTVVRLA